MLENKNALHYDLDFIGEGKKWKPSEDTTRLDNYEFARKQFELTEQEAARQLLPSGLLDLRDYDAFCNFTKLLAYPRLLTLKTVDMVIGQPPIISVSDDDARTEAVKKVRTACQLNSAFKQALIDYSRFGVFLIRVFKDEENQPQIVAWNPGEWIPVFYPDGTNRIRYNVIAWRHEKELTFQIHDTKDGSYEQRVCEVDATNTIVRIKSSRKYNRRSGKRLLYAVTNTPTTTNPLGTGDYEIINGLLQKAIERLTAILRVLDEHADPSMTGPYSLLEKGPDGQVVFKTSKYYATGKEEQKPEYLVWDANLDSSFKAFDELCKQIYILSEMGEAFLGTSGGTSNVVSGTAMRFKMISPLEKARRISNDITEPFKEIISTLMYMSGTQVDASELNVAWKDSLPKDPREVAELARLEAGSPAVKPLLHAVMDNYDIDKKTAEHYVENIIKDLKTFSEAQVKKTDPATGEDGRSHGATGSIDIRKKGSPRDPASSENRGEDSGK